MADIPLPPSIEQVTVLDPNLGERIGQDFTRLIRASGALLWAQQRLPGLVAAGSPTAVLQFVVAEAKQLTGVPSVWAVTWKGDLGKGTASFRALAGADGVIPAPVEISRSIIAQCVKDGRPAWTDDASSDARFVASHSVQNMALRSVGCVPIGDHGVLYLHDPDNPGRFGAEARARLPALCSLAAPFLKSERRTVRPRLRAEAIPGVVGDSPAMSELYALVRAFAPMPWPALILGETGTGKELIAKAMHELSPRSGGAFVAVNCGAIPEELAESTLFGHERGAFTGADRRKEGMVQRVREGTLFLDEVGELSPRIQVKLLRLLQEGTFEPVGGERNLPFRGRVLAATHRQVDDPEARGEFREDLFHRLSACVIRAPALRERRGDIPALAEHLLARSLGDLKGVPSLSISPKAVSDLSGRGWSGNVRELENVIRGAIARCLACGGRVIESEHLVGSMPTAAAAVPEAMAIGNLQEATDTFQQLKVRDALGATGGNRTKAAEMLGVSRQWLHRLIQRWGGEPS